MSEQRTCTFRDGDRYCRCVAASDSDYCDHHKTLDWMGRLGRIEQMLTYMMTRMYPGHMNREGWARYFAEQEQAERSRAIVERGVRDRELNESFDQMMAAHRASRPKKRWWRMPWLSD